LYLLCIYIHIFLFHLFCSNLIYLMDTQLAHFLFLKLFMYLFRSNLSIYSFIYIIIIIIFFCKCFSLALSLPCSPLGVSRPQFENLLSVHDPFHLHDRFYACAVDAVENAHAQIIILFCDATFDSRHCTICSTHAHVCTARQRKWSPTEEMSEMRSLPFTLQYR